MPVSRRKALQILAAAGITGPAAAHALAQARRQITSDNLKNATALMNQEYDEERLQVIKTALQRNLDQFQSVRDLEIDDLIEPAPIFDATRH
jgi:ribosomal protein L12E/L44/L45/RPP1/RPP2